MRYFFETYSPTSFKLGGISTPDVSGTEPNRDFMFHVYGVSFVKFYEILVEIKKWVEENPFKTNQWNLQTNHFITGMQFTYGNCKLHIVRGQSEVLFSGYGNDIFNAIPVILSSVLGIAPQDKGVIDVALTPEDVWIINSLTDNISFFKDKVNGSVENTIWLNRRTGSWLSKLKGANRVDLWGSK